MKHRTTLAMLAIGPAFWLSGLAMGCAGNPPKEAIASAHTLVQRAEQEGAAQFAPRPLREAKDKAEHEREQYRKLYMLVLYELERLKRQLFGKKAETVDPAQVQLVFGPVFDALARAEKGVQGAQHY